MLTIAPIEKIDFVEELSTQVLCTTLFEDLGAPKSVTGMLDWRLHGFVSHNMVRQTIMGHFGETTLMPLPSSFQARKVVLLGLGSWRQYNDQTLKKALTHWTPTLMRLKADHITLCIPRLLKESFEGETEKILQDYLGPLGQQMQLELRITSFI
jgi:hypothetical protein